MKKITSILFGIVLILCGSVYMLDAFGITNFQFSLDGWWAFFIIIPCLSGLVTSKDKIGNLIGLLVGVLLFLAAQGVFSFDLVWKILVPAIIMLIGVKFIFKAFYSSASPESDSAEENHTSFFNSQTIDYTGKEVPVAKVSAVFGGATCNLTNAIIKEGSQLNLLCVFGGADLMVPENVNIKINACCIFGGISDKRAVKPAGDTSVTLEINGFCLFGGADIK